MSLTITVQTERFPDLALTPAQQVEEALAAIGFVRVPVNAVTDTIAEAIAYHAKREVTSAVSALSVGETDKAPEPAASIEADKPKRGRKPKEEKAVATTEEKPQISSGENRVGPEDDPAEVQEQDAADEAAESAAAAKPETLSLDDVRKLAGQYVQKYGAAAAQADGAGIIGEALGPVPAGSLAPDGVTQTDRWRIALIPEDQDSLRKAVDAWHRAVEENPMNREVVSVGG